MRVMVYDPLKTRVDQVLKSFSTVSTLVGQSATPESRRSVNEATRQSSNQRPAHCPHSDRNLANDHWITSSARSSSDCGIVRPSALAVLRLMASAYLAGCSNGSSPGFAPLRILST